MAHPRRIEEDRFCKCCGKKLERKRFNNRLEDYSVFSKRLYCDKECMRKDWIGKSQTQSYRNSHQTARTTAILFFPEITICAICGKVGKMDIHHINEDWQDNRPENLVVLCRSCHMKIHKTKRSELWTRARRTGTLK